MSEQTTETIRYIGPLRRAFVVLDGLESHVEQGGTIEVPAALAKRLCEQGSNWEAAQPRGGKAKAAPKGDEETPA